MLRSVATDRRLQGHLPGVRVAGKQQAAPSGGRSGSGTGPASASGAKSRSRAAAAAGSSTQMIFPSSTEKSISGRTWDPRSVP